MVILQSAKTAFALFIIAPLFVLFIAIPALILCAVLDLLGIIKEPRDPMREEYLR